MHVFAYWTVASYANANLASDTAALVGITGTLVLSWSLLLSQAMESVTRAFYSRSDLDLILTSPIRADHGRADARCSIRRNCLRSWHSIGGCSGDGDPALLPRAGAAQPISPQADLIAPCHMRRGLFVNRLGSDNGTGGCGNLGGARHRSDRVRHSGRRLAGQSNANVTFKRMPRSGAAARPVFRPQAD